MALQRIDRFCSNCGGKNTDCAKCSSKNCSTIVRGPCATKKKTFGCLCCNAHLYCKDCAPKEMEIVLIDPESYPWYQHVSKSCKRTAMFMIFEINKGLEYVQTEYGPDLPKTIPLLVLQRFLPFEESEKPA